MTLLYAMTSLENCLLLALILRRCLVFLHGGHTLIEAEEGSHLDKGQSEILGWELWIFSSLCLGQQFLLCSLLVFLRG